MEVRYDRRANAATIYLLSRAEHKEVKKSYQCDFNEVGGIINLDFDEEGKLLSIELIHARTLLPQEVLDQAESIG